LSEASKNEELISLYRSDSSLMDDAVGRLIVKLYSYREKHGKSSILLTGCNPGCGTTTTAINLAIALAGAGWNTLLVDVDMRKGMKYKRLTGAGVGLSDYLERRMEIDSIVFRTSKAKLRYVSCGLPETNTVRLLCSERMERFVAETRDAFDFIVFDCPSLSVVPDATVLFPSVDCISLVLALGSTTKKQLAAAKREVSKHPDKYTGLIINRVDKRQYKRLFPQFDYFEEANMRRAHRRSIRKSKHKGGE